MKTRLGLIMAMLTFGMGAIAQNNWCGTDAYNNALLNELSSAEAEMVKSRHHKIFQNTQNQHSKMGTVYYIPVVVHVIHDNCEGNISKQQIEDGIAVLNEDFRRLNTDTNKTRGLFKNLAADIEIQFVLANIDPNGNCTEGIVRINSDLTYNARNNVKSLSYWSSSKYMNVWLVQSIESGGGTGGITLGFAQFPGFGSWSTYGIVVRNDRWGRIGSSNDDGRTATHEIGHCFGLLHTFQSGCGSSCNNSGDRICDTPPSRDPTFSCSSTQNTCSNDAQGSGSAFTSNVVDMVENYMSYDPCQNMFTLKQKSAMRSTLNQFSQLSNLISTNNLAATGTSPGYVKKLCKPIGDYCIEETHICEGTSLTFVDRSYNGKVSGRNWSFPGGSPASSSDSSVTVTYNTSGTYDVQLTISNASGNDTKESKGIINVHPIIPDYDHFRYEENFEDQQQFDSLWRVNPAGSKAWTLIEDVAYTGIRSVKFLNFVNTTDDYVTELITPSYNLQEVFLPQLNFKVAYARKSSSSLDQLRLHYSQNCGESWNMMTIKSAVTLESVSGNRTNNWEPADATEWKQIDVTISSNLASKPNLRFKFEFIAGGGNNIFIDDINISSTTGIEDIETNKDLRIFPNPTNGMLNIESLNGVYNWEEIRITNIAGQVIYSRPFGADSPSTGKELIDLTGVQPGIYFVQIVQENGTVGVKKLVIQ